MRSSELQEAVLSSSKLREVVQRSGKQKTKSSANCPDYRFRSNIPLVNIHFRAEKSASHCANSRTNHFHAHSMIDTNSRANSEEQTRHRFHSVAGGNGSGRDNRAPILRIHTDVMDEIFEYLPLKDLLAIAQARRSLQLAAGEHFQCNHADLVHKAEHNGSIHLMHLKGFETNAFKEFFATIKIRELSRRSLASI